MQQSTGRAIYEQQMQKKLQFMHKLTVSDTSNTANITRYDITQQHVA